MNAGLIHICPRCGEPMVPIKIPVAALTRRQRQCFQVIAIFMAGMGYPPSLDQIAQMLGIKSRGAAHGLVQGLIARGYAKRSRHAPNSIQLLTPKNDGAPYAAAA